MYKANLNEMAAMQLVFEYISFKDLITAAMHTFAKGESIKDKDNADLCFKAIETFLK